MKTIKIPNGKKDALVDDDVYYRLSMHNWFFDRTQLYTKLSFSTEKKVGPKTFTLKVRMDHYVFNYTPYINATIKHRDGDPYNCQRSNLIVQIKDPGTSQYRRTIYLGVIETPTVMKTRAKEKDRFVRMSVEKYEGTQSHIVGGGNNPTDLAEFYDDQTRVKHGKMAHTNFLMEPLPHRNEKDEE